MENKFLENYKYPTIFFIALDIPVDFYNFMYKVYEYSLERTELALVFMILKIINNLRQIRVVNNKRLLSALFRAYLRHVTV